jgi:hypothetical protein
MRFPFAPTDDFRWAGQWGLSFPPRHTVELAFCWLTKNLSYTPCCNLVGWIPPTADIGGLAMKKQLILECPTGYDLVCKKDSEQGKYQCCCCARAESQLCETDPYVELNIWLDFLRSLNHLLVFLLIFSGYTYLICGTKRVLCTEVFLSPPLPTTSKEWAFFCSQCLVSG